jgi:hypothetical protein
VKCSRDKRHVSRPQSSPLQCSPLLILWLMSLRYFDVYNIWATFGERREMAGIPRGRRVDVHILRIYTRPDRLLQEAFKISEGAFLMGLESR